MRQASSRRSAALVCVLGIVACTTSHAGGDASEAAENAGSSGIPGPLGDIDGVPTSASCVLPDAPPNPVKSVRVARALTFTRPTSLAIAAGGRTFVVEQQGRIKTFSGDDATTATTTLDIASRVKSDDIESGLLGIALSPKFATTGELFYTFITNESGNESWALERVKTDGAVADPSTIERVLTIPDYHGHLYGAWIAFGADGMLYASTGEGDESEQSYRAQNKGDLHGKLLRIDVLGARPYTVPADNPFVGVPGVRPELWAYGFRNPWKFGFDSKDGTLFVSDVGAYTREEVNVVAKGKNYGWNVMEGTTCFNADTCDASQIVPPAFEYQHNESLAVVAGVVYRGTKIPSLEGAFIHADWAMNWIRALDRQADGTWKTRFLDWGRWTSGFAEDPVSRELSLVDFVDGGVYRLEANAVTPMPPTLSATGCGDATDLSKAAKGFLAYDVNMPLWSDGADKRRFFALPVGGQITVREHGAFDLPPGSVAFKSFSLAGKPIEVRLLVHHKSGEWAGYSYMVRDDGSDADLVPETTDKKVGNQTWTYPGRSQCFGCHNNNEHRTLGLETAQLNMGSPNQLDVLSRANAFDPVQEPASALPRLAKREDPDSDEWTRAYLHANCGVCHRSPGILISGMDMRYWTSFADMRLCRPPLASRYGAKGDVFQPGAPDDSVLLTRVSRRGSGQMPPLASHSADTLAVNRIHDWIARTKTCP